MNCPRCEEKFVIIGSHQKTFKCRGNARDALECSQFSSARTVECESCFKSVQGHQFDHHKQTNRCKFINAMNPLEKIVFFNSDKFDYRSLSKNPLVTIDLVELLDDKPWDWKAISRNHTKERREKYPEKLWYDIKRPDKNLVHSSRSNGEKETYTYLEPYEMNSGIQIPESEMFYFKPEQVSASPLLRASWIRKNPNYPWDWGIIAKNDFKI